MNLENMIQTSLPSGEFHLICGDLTNFTTLRLKSEGQLVQVFSLRALETLLQCLNKHQLPYQVIGHGSNLYLPSKISNKILVQLKFPYQKPQYENGPIQDLYTFAASTPLSYLSKLAMNLGLGGWEVFTGIPATLGGAIYMNAGTGLGEIASILRKVKILTPAGRIKEIEIHPERDFQYRKSRFMRTGEIILQATLGHFGFEGDSKKKITDYLQYRNRTQPMGKANCGCVFKNLGTHRVGLYIDRLGLKGLCSKYSNLQISHLHGNFIINRNLNCEAQTGQRPADFQEFKEFVEQIQKF